MAKPNPLPPLQYLRECFDLDVPTGLIWWKRRPLSHFKTKRGYSIFNSSYAGRPADQYITNAGYRQVRVSGRLYLVHRIVWKMIHGSDPAKLLDHINGVRIDNSPGNLREVNDSQNAFNSVAPSGKPLKGASLHWNGSYRAQIMKDRKHIHLGLFKTPEEAHAAYVAAAKKLHGEFACVDSHRPVVVAQKRG